MPGNDLNHRLLFVTFHSLCRNVIRYRMIRRLLLCCGILSSLLYIGMNIYVPMQYKGYNTASQTVSELSAIGASTRQLWISLVIWYALLLTAFGWGVLKSAGRNRPLHIAGVLIFIHGITGFFWPPMHQREVLAAGGGTLTDTMHIVFAVITVLLMMFTIGFGAAAKGRRFRLYSILTMVVLFSFGALTGKDAPRVSTNLPTPYAGIWERINIGVYMLWIIVLAVLLLPDGLANDEKRDTG